MWIQDPWLYSLARWIVGLYERGPGLYISSDQALAIHILLVHGTPSSFMLVTISSACANSCYVLLHVPSTVIGFLVSFLTRHSWYIRTNISTFGVCSSDSVRKSGSRHTHTHSD